MSRSAVTIHKIAGFSIALLLASALTMLGGCGGGPTSGGTAGGGSPSLTGGTGGTGGGGTGGTTTTTTTTTGGTTTTTTATASMTIGLTNSAGAVTTSISSGSPATVNVTVKDAAGAAVPNIVITFTTDPAMATMTPSSGTALTNAAGVASITLSAASLTAAGATYVTAAAQIGTGATAASLSASIGYSVGASTIAVSTPVFGVNPLSAYGTTSVVVNVTSGGLPVTSPQTVTFSSPCSASGKAILGSVTTVNGVATGSYRDNGCGGTDTVTATVSGGAVTSSATLTVVAPATGSIQYVSATPVQISLQGSGGTSTSMVVFKVLDGSGNPISGKTVTFGLSTTLGGITLAATSGISAADGTVVATVSSGTIATPVRVTATTPGTGTTILSTQSSQLTITTGIPDEFGFSVSASQHNIEGWSYDGVTSVITARLADHFKNLPPDGTTVNFTSEASSITGSCNTTSGGCSATFTSQGTRPTNGRVTLLGYAIGEETFTDLNGNGVADLVSTGGLSEMIDANGKSTDLPEAWVDYNENGVRDATEPYFDFNANGVYDAPDGKYSGVLCSALSSAGTCAASKTLHVRSQQVIVLSSSNPAPIVFGNPPIASVTLPPCTATTAGTPVTFPIRVTDINGNAMPAGTTVAVSTSNGTITGFGSGGGTSFVYPDSTGCNTSFAGCPATANPAPFASLATYGEIPITMRSSGTWNATTLTCSTPTSPGILTVTVTSPKGTVTSAGLTVY